MKIEKETSTNLLYKDHPNKFINEMLLDLVKVFKLEIIREEIDNLNKLSDKGDEILKKINSLQQIKHKIQNHS